MEKFKFENLNVYQDALVLIEMIYFVTKKWPKEELFGLTSQIRRSVVSIALNIAEGTSRTKKDFRHFLDLARGSVYESVAILHIAEKQGYVTAQEFKKLSGLLVKISKMTSALKKSLV